eukprot:GHVU01106805.1.p1 GENE.GHVU01106805.1~~GHVU01106805.1.p1  ORF type:complete len:589 (+),score=48.93 GHVU01106805.1:646-2412(+)
MGNQVSSPPQASQKATESVSRHYTGPYTGYYEIKCRCPFCNYYPECGECRCPQPKCPDYCLKACPKLECPRCPQDCACPKLDCKDLTCPPCSLQCQPCRPCECKPCECKCDPIDCSLDACKKCSCMPLQCKPCVCAVDCQLCSPCECACQPCKPCRSECLPHCPECECPQLKCQPLLCKPCAPCPPCPPCPTCPACAPCHAACKAGKCIYKPGKCTQDECTCCVLGCLYPTAQCAGGKCSPVSCNLFSRTCLTGEGCGQCGSSECGRNGCTPSKCSRNGCTPSQCGRNGCTPSKCSRNGCTPSKCILGGCASSEACERKCERFNQACATSRSSFRSFFNPKPSSNVTAKYKNKPTNPWTEFVRSNAAADPQESRIVTYWNGSGDPSRSLRVPKNKIPTVPRGFTPDEEEADEFPQVEIRPLPSGYIRPPPDEEENVVRVGGEVKESELVGEHANIPDATPTSVFAENLQGDLTRMLSAPLQERQETLRQLSGRYQLGGPQQSSSRGQSPKLGSASRPEEAAAGKAEPKDPESPHVEAKPTTGVAAAFDAAGKASLGNSISDRRADASTVGTDTRRTRDLSSSAKDTAH